MERTCIGLMKDKGGKERKETKLVHRKRICHSLFIWRGRKKSYARPAPHPQHHHNASWEAVVEDAAGLAAVAVKDTTAQRNK